MISQESVSVNSTDELNIPFDLSDIIAICKEFSKLG